MRSREHPDAFERCRRGATGPRARRRWPVRSVAIAAAILTMVATVGTGEATPGAATAHHAASDRRGW